MVETDFDTYAVDTPEDRVKVEKTMQSDPLVRQY